MVILLGASGYIGTEFAQQLTNNGTEWATYPHTGPENHDYTTFTGLRNILTGHTPRPTWIINCAGYTGKPNVDACEKDKAECLRLNTVFPIMMRTVCESHGVPWLHVSSGCIYSGGKVAGETVTDLLKYKTSEIEGFTEEDEPNFSFVNPPCSFYSGTKAIAEQGLSGEGLAVGDGYVCRLRIPFDEFHNPRNYLTKLLNYEKYYNNVNSFSNREEFVSACLQLCEIDAPRGVYNITNPGHMTTDDVVSKMSRIPLQFNGNKVFSRFEEQEFKDSTVAPRSNCVLDSSKLTDLGIKMRPIDEALDDSIKKYKLLPEEWN